MERLRTASRIVGRETLRNRASSDSPGRGMSSTKVLSTTASRIFSTALATMS